MPSIATVLLTVTVFVSTSCFGPYGPTSGEISISQSSEASKDWQKQSKILLCLTAPPKVITQTWWNRVPSLCFHHNAQLNQRYGICLHSSGAMPFWHLFQFTNQWLIFPSCVQQLKAGRRSRAIWVRDTTIHYSCVDYVYLTQFSSYLWPNYGLKPISTHAIIKKSVLFFCLSRQDTCTAESLLLSSRPKQLLASQESYSEALRIINNLFYPCCCYYEGFMSFEGPWGSVHCCNTPHVCDVK
jgi:hypothetical protein